MKIYINKTNLSDLEKRIHRIRGKRGSENLHDSLNQIENEVVDSEIASQTLTVGPFFEGTIYLQMKKNLSGELYISKKNIKILTRSPNQPLEYDTDEKISTIDKKTPFCIR